MISKRSAKTTSTDNAIFFSAAGFEASQSIIFRCAKCNKLLAKENSKGMLAGEIKCPRCGTYNEI